MSKLSVFFISLLLIGTAAAFAEPDPASDPMEILHKANAAAAELSAVAYEARMYGEGPGAERMASYSGKVVAQRNGAAAPPYVFVDGVATPFGQPNPSPFEFSTDGKVFASVNHQEKSFSTGEFNKNMPIPLFQPRFLNSAPYSEEINNGLPEFIGVQDVDGVSCNVLSITGKGPRAQTVKFFLGTDDHLLRRMEAAIRSPGPAGDLAAPNNRVVFTIAKLDPHPKIDEKMFHLTCPPGYQQKSLETARPASAPGLLAVGTPAPEWELTSAEGTTVSLKGLRGKVVLLDFWATWCGPCKMAMPSLQKLHERFKDKPVAIFGVNCRERNPNIDPMAYIKEKGFTYGQLLKGDAVATAYRVNGIPCLYLIDREGKILHAASGFHPQLEEQLAGIIEANLK